MTSGKSVAASQAAARSRRVYRQSPTAAGKPAPKNPVRPGAQDEARKALEAERKASPILARPQALPFSIFKTEADEAWR